MDYTLRYRSSRSEVWRWYWTSWASERWRAHFVLFSLVVAVSLAIGWPSFRKLGIAVALGGAIAGICLAVLSVAVLSAFFSQLFFKSAERELVVTSAGWSTRIGPESGSRTWGEIRRVRDLGYAIAIEGENGNSLIVPARAFQDDAVRRRFLADSQAWQRSARS